VADRRHRTGALSAATIRERLIGTAAPADPLSVVMPEDLDSWPEPLRRRLAFNLKAAGVLVPISDRPDACTRLFTQRSPHLRYHAGQVSFPGGRMEPGDADILATALRETHDEVGIEPATVEIAGFLPSLPTVSGYAVTPIVGLVPADTLIVPDPTEVERVFEVPLDFLLEPANRRCAERDVYGERVSISEYRYASEHIWGATATILGLLSRALRYRENK
jgi:8-oxo-dGTP pyrophosphatase MutT (NUDIX family)